MFDLLRKLFMFGLLVGGGGAILWFWVFMGEFRDSEIPARAQAEGVAHPLEEVWLDVNLGKMVATLMSGETAIKRYDIGYGHAPVGRMGKDRGTPRGEYHVLRKQKEGVAPFERGSRFLVLDYPNEDDLERAFSLDVITEEEHGRLIDAYRSGTMPPQDTAMGAWLGVQGNFFPWRHRRFTDGSVAFANADLNEIYEELSVGDRVVIRE